jgi:ribosomal protein S27AE
MDSFSRMVRRSCSDCGSPLLKWTTAAGLLALVPASLRPRVIEGLSFYGADSEAWKCGKCPAFGIFGPLEMAL